MFYISYPEYRQVSDAKIITWYRDAVANGEIDSIGYCSPKRAAQALHQAGLITLSDKRRDHLRCGDCGERNCMTGHQDCMYPQDR